MILPEGRHGKRHKSEKNQHDVGLWEDFIEEPSKPELNFSQWLAADPKRQKSFDDLPSVDRDRVVLLVEKATLQSVENILTLQIENASAWGLTRAESYEFRGLLRQIESAEHHRKEQKKLSESLLAHGDNPADIIELCGRYALATGDRSTIRQQCEQYDIALDEDGLRRMIDSDNHFAQFLGFFLCRDLDDASFQSFVRYAGENMTERLQKGEQHYFDIFEKEINEREPSELGKVFQDSWDLYPTQDYDGEKSFLIQRAIMDFIADGVDMHREGIDLPMIEHAYIQCLKALVANELDTNIQPNDLETDEQFFQRLKGERAYYFNRETNINDEILMDEWHPAARSLIESPHDINHLVEPLQRFGSQRSIEFLSTFAAYLPRDTHHQIIDTLSHIDPARTSHYFIPLLRSSDEHQRDIAARVLLRLEFGPIAVSNDGVEYLGNQYDLGPMNNDAYTAHRLTADGKIGVFDEQQHLIRYFPLEQMDSDAKRIIAKVMRLTPDLLFRATPSDSDETRRKRAEALELFQREYFRFFESGFVQQTNVQFNNLSFAEQGQLMIAYQQSNPGEREQIIDFVHRYREDGFRAFLSIQFGAEHASVVLDLGKFFQEQHFTELGEKIFSAYSNIVLEGDRARFILEDIAGTTVDADERVQASIFNIDDVIDGMLLRGKDLLVEMSDTVRGKNNITSDDLVSLVESTLAALRKETDRQRVVRGHFKRIAEILKTDNIDLANYSHAQELLWHDLANDRGLYLRVLHVMEKLAPIPEIHWRVDRTPQEYARRFGFDVRQFFVDRAPKNRKGVLLEFGPGSGVAKEHCKKTGIDRSYDDFSIADTLYYNPASVIEKLIDWEKMGASFQDPAARAMFCDFLYKTIVIERDQTERDHFEYDVVAREQLTDDPNALKEQLRRIGEKIFADIDMVPDTIASRDAEGRVRYPYKLRTDRQSPEWRARQSAFAENPDAFLRSDIDALDVYNEIPAFPPGIMVGDFKDVERLRDNQVDAALGVRSTVYKKNEEYIHFMETIALKLAEGGVYIDDNIRDNDGWYYRVGEIFTAQQHLEERGVTDVKFWVILGPGFEREDYRRDAVPLAIVAARDADVSGDISARLASGFRIIPFGELARNRDYLKTLDASGRTLSERDRYVADSTGDTAR